MSHLLTPDRAPHRAHSATNHKVARRALLALVAIASVLTVLSAGDGALRSTPAGAAPPNDCPSGTVPAAFTGAGAGTGNEATWSSANGDASTGVYTVAYTDSDGQATEMTVTLTMRDPSGRNNQSGRAPLWPQSDDDPLLTQTGGGYGPGFLTFGMSSLDSSETVTLEFGFSKPVLMSDFVVGDFVVGDVDFAGLDLDESTSLAEEPGNSFQNEVAFDAFGPDGEVPITITGGTTLQVVGQTVRPSGYAPDVNGNVSHTDPVGFATVNPSASRALTNLAIAYRNGPDDAAAEQAHAARYVGRYAGAPEAALSGASDDHGVAIPGFGLCVVDPQVDLAKTVYAGHDRGAGCPGSEVLTDVVPGSDLTYCFVVTNTSSTSLTDVGIDDETLGIDDSAMTLLSGDDPLAPASSVGAGDGGTQVWYHERSAPPQPLVNSATVTASPSTAAGEPIPSLDPVTDTDTAEVVIDDTPQLAKSFDPPITRVGSPSTLTFTITSPTGLGARFDWGFTDDLPSGLIVADDPNQGGTCEQHGGAAFTTSAAPGGTTITVSGGDLDVGETSCTVTVDVTSDGSGTYVNGPDNMTALVGLDPPSEAPVQFIDPAISLAKTAHPSTVTAAGQTVTYTFETTNTGLDPLTDVQVADGLPGLSPLDCGPTDLAPGPP